MSGEPASRFAWAGAFEPTEAEQKIIDCAATGEAARFEEPAEIRAECLRILLLGLRPDWPVTHRGVMAAGPPIAEDKEAALRITGELDLSFGRAPDGGALPRIILNNCAFDGRVLLTGGHFAEIGLANTRNLRLQGSNCRVERHVWLDGARLIDGAVFDGAEIKGQFSANGARFLNRGGNALRFDGAAVDGGVFLDRARAYGETDCSHAAIKGQFCANGARFLNRAGNALRLDSAAIDGGVLLRDACIAGETDCAGAAIKGQFFANGARFRNRGGRALRLDSAAIDGGVFFVGAGIEGGVHAAFSQLRTLNLVGARLRAEASAVSLNLYRATISGAMIARDLDRGCDGRWSLVGADINTINDDPQTGWPRAGQLDLDGLTYRAIGSTGDDRDIAGKRIAWLKRQYESGEPKRGEFRPQPFEQLARTLKAQGHDYAATQIQIEKREMQRKCADRGFARFLHTVLKITSDYGYSPARALIWFAGWVVAGAILARVALERGLFERVNLDSPEALHLEPVAYAFDLSTPIIDFGQASAYRFIPGCADALGVKLCGALELAEVAYSTLGFILFSILVLTLTGVLRREGS